MQPPLPSSSLAVAAAKRSNASTDGAELPDRSTPLPPRSTAAGSAQKSIGLHKAIRQHLDEHANVVRHGALGRDNIKMSDWRTRRGVVFAYENETGKLWVPDTSALRALADDIPFSSYPRVELWTRTNRSGVRLYGRHSALRTIDELRDANLLRFAPSTMIDAARVLAMLLQM